MKGDLKKVTTNFSRGLSTLSPHLINPDEVQVSENFLFDDGAPYVRKGIRVYGSVNAPIVSLYKLYKKNGSSYFVAFAGGQLHAAATSGNFVQVSCETLQSGPVNIAAYTDYLYFTNYSNVIKHFDGSSIDNTGLSGPIFRKQICDFEANEVWTSGVADTRYMNIDHGLQAWKLNTSGPHATATSGFVRGDTSTTLNLARYASNVSSDDADEIHIFVCPERKGNISTIDLLFDCNNGDFSSISGDCYRYRISNISGYVSLSGDGQGRTYIVPKGLFSTPSSGYQWSTVIGIRVQLAQAAAPAVCTFDNVRMVKNPPLVTTISTKIEFGYTYPEDKPTKPHAKSLAWVKYNYENREYERNKKRTIEGIATSGIMSGIWYYKVTFAKQGPHGLDIESNPTMQTSGIMVSGNANERETPKISRIPIAPSEFGDCYRNLYRRKNTATDFQLVTAIFDNTTTDYIDNVGNEGILGDVLEDDHDPPPKAKYILLGSNQKMYYFNVIQDEESGPSRLCWSKSYEPYYVPLSNGTEVSPNDGTEGTGIFEFRGLIHLLKHRSLWTIDDSDEIRNVHPTIGCIAPKSLAQGENEVFWLSQNGVILYNLLPKNISQPKGGGSNIQKIIDRLPSDYIQNSVGIYWNGYYLLAVTDEGSTYNNLVLAYHTKTDTWTMFPSLNVECWTSWTGGKDAYKLFFGNLSGQVCEFMIGDYDVSTPIASKLRSKEFGEITPQFAYRMTHAFIEDLDTKVRTLKMEPYYDLVTISGDATRIAVSGTYNLVKFDLPQKPGVSYCSVQFSSSGRYKILQTDLYGKEEEIR